MARVLLKVLAPLRGVAVTLWFFPHTAFCAFAILLGAIVFRGRWFYDFVIRDLWAKPALKFAGIHEEVLGSERFPKNEGCLVVFNHTSWVDILVLVTALPTVPRFGAKIELFRIPFFGGAMRRAGMLPIERNNRNKVLQIYKEAEARAAAGECFALAPEGTRQRGHVLGKFKQGPFLFAVGAQMPLVPVVIAGAQEAMPKGALLINAWQWRRTVAVRILSPISARGRTETEVASLQDELRAAMVPAYAELNRALGLPAS